MKDNIHNKRRSKRGSSSGNGLVIGLSIGGGIFALLIVGVVLYFALGKSKSRDGDGGDDSTPSKVSDETIYAVDETFDLAKLEALLGKGHTPTTGDFDAIFGKDGPDQRFNKMAEQRPLWEENNRRGLVMAWGSGSVRMLVTLTQPPDRGGRVIAKLMKAADGSVTMQSGSVNPVQPTPTPTPKGNTPPQAAPSGSWEQLVGTWEVEGDPRLRFRFGADKKIGEILLSNGKQVREKTYIVRDVQIENGRIAPQLDLGTVNGKAMVSPALGVFWFENGTLHRDPGNGKPPQTLRRVN